MRSVNIYETFPVKDADSMTKYLLKDAEYEDRKQQFYSVLIPALCDDKKKFCNALFSKVFSLQYILDHRWPTET